MVLGFGARVPADGNIFARRAFLEAVWRLVPDVGRGLEVIALRPSFEEYPDVQLFDVESERALRAWAERWGFPYADAFWMAVIRQHVRHWHAFPETAGSLLGTIGHYSLHETRIQPWQPTEETEAAFRTRVESYIAAVKRDVHTRPTPIFSPRDFDTLVCEHVLGVTIEQIPAMLSDEDGDETADTSTIRRHNKELAAVLGLRLRRRPASRPKKVGK
jgi:hypothetical protein